MSLRQRASNYALLTIDETPTPPRGANGSIASAGCHTGSPAKYPTPLAGNWADYAAWSPNAHQQQDAAGDVPSDTMSDEHNLSHEHSQDDSSPQARHFDAPVVNDPYYNAIQYPTTPYGLPAAQVDYSHTDAAAYSVPPPVYQYPSSYQMCTCGCGQMIPADSYDAQYAPPPTAPWQTEPAPPAVEPVVPSEPQSTFVPRFGPPPPPPVKMAQLLTEHGNPQGENVRYNAVFRWYERIQNDAPHFAPDVTPIPHIDSNEPFDKIVVALNEWWKRNFGERQSHHASRSGPVQNPRPVQPLQPIRSATLSQYSSSSTIYDRSGISSRRHN